MVDNKSNAPGSDCTAILATKLYAKSLFCLLVPVVFYVHHDFILL